jgi:hypothetical protein
VCSCSWGFRLVCSSILERRIMGTCHGWFLRIGSNTVFYIVVFSLHLWQHVGASGFGVLLVRPCSVYLLDCVCSFLLTLCFLFRCCRSVVDACCWDWAASVSSGRCEQRCGAAQLHSSLVTDTSVCASPSRYLYFFPFVCRSRPVLGTGCSLCRLWGVE